MATMLNELVEYTNQLLDITQFQDYCPNGLQVEGKKIINRIVCGVSACQELLDQATQRQADLILVHHGYFWKNENPCVVGLKYRHLKTLLAHDMSLLAYHLPLDCHPVYGNNVMLANVLDFELEKQVSCKETPNLLSVGQLKTPLSLDQLAAHIAQALKRTPITISAGSQPIKRIAWCTGGAQDFIEEAAALGVDAYLTGEASEQTTHLARELGIHFIGAGHHATERYGVQALGQHLAEFFNLTYEYIEIDNPI